MLNYDDSFHTWRLVACSLIHGAVGAIRKYTISILLLIPKRELDADEFLLFLLDCFWTLGRADQCHHVGGLRLL